MPATWNETWAEAEAVCTVDQFIFETIELQHPAFVEGVTAIPLRFVLDVEPRTFGIEAGATFNAGESVEFTPIAFEAATPDFAEGKIPECKIVVDNVGRDLMPHLEAAVQVRADLVVILRRYLEDDVSEPFYGPVQFMIRQVRVTGARVEGMARLEDLTNQKFPNRVYSRSLFPALMVG